MQHKKDIPHARKGNGDIFFFVINNEKFILRIVFLGNSSYIMIMIISITYVNR